MTLSTALPQAATVDERWLRRRDVEELIGYSKNTIYRLIREQGFPEPYKPGGASSRWSRREVVEWMDKVKVAK